MNLNVFTVKYGTVWDDAPEDDSMEKPAAVLAKDAESAIAKVRKSEVGRKAGPFDEEGNPAKKGKALTCTNIVVYSVTHVTGVDLK